MSNWANRNDPRILVRQVRSVVFTVLETSHVIEITSVKESGSKGGWSTPVARIENTDTGGCASIEVDEIGAVASAVRKAFDLFEKKFGTVPVNI